MGWFSWGSKKTEKTADDHYRKALKAVEKGNYVKGVKQFRKAIEKDEEYEGNYELNLAILLFHLEEYEAGLEYLGQASNYGNEDADRLIEYIETLVEEQNSSSALGELGWSFLKGVVKGLGGATVTALLG